MTSEDLEKARKQRDREALAKLQAADLMAQWETVEATEQAADEARKAVIAARQKYTAMLAEALNVRVGMRVTQTRKQGYVNGGTLVTKTYEVTDFSLYFGPTNLRLWGRTVRKDGSLGERFEIGTDWQRI